ncbi:MAG: hypothetical protein IJ188_06530 [Clostridia bacterium]|nr:hypothetical protein [Clostridia bacterium]
MEAELMTGDGLVRGSAVVDGGDGGVYNKKCPNCGKQFYAGSCWVYKLMGKRGYDYYCRYNCWRAAQKERESKAKGKAKTHRGQREREP